LAIVGLAGIGVGGYWLYLTTVLLANMIFTVILLDGKISLREAVELMLVYVILVSLSLIVKTR
jgi:hypothetical protein